MQAHPESLRGVQAVHGPRGSRRGQGGAGPEPLQPAVKHEKLDKRCVAELSVKPNTQLHPGLCAGGSRTNGSRYPLGARRGLPRFNRRHQLLHGFFTKFYVKSFQNHLPS